MGKKRKKSPGQLTPSAPPAVVMTTEPPVSQPALSEEMAAEIVAASEAPPAVAAEVKVEAKVEEAKVEEAEVIETKAIETAVIEPKVEERVEEKVEAAPASEIAPASAAPVTTRPKKKRPKKRTTKPPVSREALDQKIDRLEAKLEEKKDAAAKAAREGFGSKPDDDDQSVPPVDLEVHDAFFAAGEKEHVVKESGSYAALDPRHAQKMSAVAHARRAHLTKYVKWSVGMAAGILMLGFAIKTLRGRPNEEPVRREVVHATQTDPPTQQQPVQQPQNVAPPAVVEIDDKKVDEAKTDDKKTDENAAADNKATTPDETDKKDDLPPEKPKNAWQEKQAAKAALERGANATAIQAGERSVALDPSDGEAWLVLGGAYQAMGNNGQAKRCYNACVTQGKKGPISDCKDVLGSL